MNLPGLRQPGRKRPVWDQWVRFDGGVTIGTQTTFLLEHTFLCEVLTYADHSMGPLFASNMFGYRDSKSLGCEPMSSLGSSPCPSLPTDPFLANMRT
jgi:hypothetical protein